jgi:hypothetical protein
MSEASAIRNPVDKPVDHVFEDERRAEKIQDLLPGGW